MKYSITNDGVYLYTRVNELIHDMVNDDKDGVKEAVYKFGQGRLLIVHYYDMHLTMTDPIVNETVMDVIFEREELDESVIKFLVLERIKRYYKL